MNYTELDVWLISRKLVKSVYELTNSFPKNETYGLTSQIRRSVISVPSNIGEGCGRQTTKETIQFLYISRGSLYELETQLYLAYDLEYLDKTTLENILSDLRSCAKLLNGFINYYKNK